MTIPPYRWLSMAATHTVAAAGGAAFFALISIGKQEDSQHILIKDEAPDVSTTNTSNAASAAAPTMPVSVLRPHPDMEIAFDARTRNPVYSLERIPPQHVRRRKLQADDAGSAQLGKTRQGMNFHEEKSLPSSHRSRNSYYKHSGYDRGHLIPASDFRGDTNAVSATFNLCNVSPQSPKVNRRIWGRLEALIRSMAKEEWDGNGEEEDIGRRSTYVVTGPVWLPSSIVKEENTSKTGQQLKPLFQFSHLAIGQPPSLIHVPTHFFKVVAVVNDKENRIEKFAAFVVPNEDSAAGRDIDLQRYLVRLSDLEAVTGMAFFPRYLGAKLDDEIGSSASNSNESNLRNLADALTEDIWDKSLNNRKSMDTSVASSASTDIVPSTYTSTGAIKRRREKMLAQALDISFGHLCEENKCSVIVKASK